jgi:hypothetical protein
MDRLRAGRIVVEHHHRLVARHGRGHGGIPLGRQGGEEVGLQYSRHYIISIAVRVGGSIVQGRKIRKQCNPNNETSNV